MPTFHNVWYGPAGGTTVTERYDQVVVPDETWCQLTTEADMIATIMGTAWGHGRNRWAYDTDGYTFTLMRQEGNKTRFEADGRYSSWRFGVNGDLSVSGPW